MSSESFLIPVSSAPRTYEALPEVRWKEKDAGHRVGAQLVPGSPPQALPQAETKSDCSIHPLKTLEMLYCCFPKWAILSSGRGGGGGGGELGDTITAFKT